MKGGNSLIFSDVTSKYLDFIKLKNKPQSFRTIKNLIVNYLEPFFKDKKIQNITAEDYLNFQISIEKQKFSFAYKKNLHFCAVEFFNYCIKFDYIEKNVASAVGNFKNNYQIEKKVDFFTLEEFNKFINVADNTVYKILFDVLFFTGIRIGEALALTFEDFNNDYLTINKTISKEFYNGKRAVTLPKTKKSIRTILIDSKLSEEINALHEYYNKTFNCVNQNFYIFGGIKPLSNTTVERYKNKYCDLANVKRIRIHDFRHSHATLLISNNVPISAVTERLGHSNISTTLNVYTHFVKEDEKRVINTLNSLRQLPNV